MMAAVIAIAAGLGLGWAGHLGLRWLERKGLDSYRYSRRSPE